MPIPSPRSALVPAVSRNGAAADAGIERRRLLLWSVLAAVLVFFAQRAYVVAVWRTGAFFDTDDTVHMLQVRDLLSGRGWFNMSLARLDPPAGTFMHWSRLVDLPVAALVELFAPFAGGDSAERLARLVLPFALLFAFLLAVARLAGLLLGRDARLPAVAAAVLSGNGVSEFAPGHIDHHGPQIVLLVLMMGSALAALDPLRVRQAAAVGLLTGLSLAINLENAPFLAVLGAWFVVRWVWIGDAARRPLGWYAGGLLLGLPAAFAATVAPSRYLLPVCDAFGAAHLGAGLIVAAAFTCVATLSAPVRRRGARAAFALATAFAAAGFVAAAYPACLHEPFAGVDPLVRELWLSKVIESLPLLTLAQTDPPTAVTAALPVALGLLGCLVATWRTSGARRAGFALVSAVVAGGLALAFWQVRVFTSVTAIATCGGLYAALAARAFWRRRGRDTLARLSLALLFPFTATAVAATLPAEAAPVADAGSTPAATFAQCLAPSAFAPMRHLRGAVITPVDAGSFVLVHTELNVFAAAFHRDDDGIRFALEIMMAPAVEAGRRAAGRHVTFILTCPGLTETAAVARRAPGGLAADLLAGRIPGWLAPLPLAGTPYRVYRVLPAAS